MAERFKIGTSAIGEHPIAVSAIEEDDLRDLAETESRLPTRLVPAGTKRFRYEANRTVYELDTELLVATADLEFMDEAPDGVLIVLVGKDAQRIVTVKDDVNDPNDDDNKGAFIVNGGDFSVSPARIIAFRYRAALNRWIEAGRVEDAVAYADIDEDPLSARLSHVHQNEHHYTLLATNNAVVF